MPKKPIPPARALEIFQRFGTKFRDDLKDAIDNSDLDKIYNLYETAETLNKTNLKNETVFAIFSDYIAKRKSYKTHDESEGNKLATRFEQKVLGPAPPPPPPPRKSLLSRR